MARWMVGTPSIMVDEEVPPSLHLMVMAKDIFSTMSELHKLGLTIITPFGRLIL